MKTTSLGGLVGLLLASASQAGTPQSTLELAMAVMPKHEMSAAERELKVELNGSKYMLTHKGKKHRPAKLRHMARDMRKLGYPETDYNTVIEAFLQEDFRLVSERAYGHASKSKHWDDIHSAALRVDPSYAPFVLGIAVNESSAGRYVRATTGAPTQGSANGIFQLCAGPYGDAQKMDASLRDVSYAKMVGTKHVGLQTRAMIAYTKYLEKIFSDAGHSEINVKEAPEVLAVAYNAGPRFVLHALESGKEGLDLIREACSVKNFRAAVDDMSDSQRSWYRKHYGPQKSMIAWKYGYGVQHHIDRVSEQHTE